MWAEQGSNLRTRERTDLQSVAFNRSAICPDCITRSKREHERYMFRTHSLPPGVREPKMGLEPATC